MNTTINMSRELYEKLYVQLNLYHLLHEEPSDILTNLISDLDAHYKENNSVIDNFDLVIPFLKFESEDDFYYLQILQRKKENPQLGSNSRVIKNYYIKSVEELLKKKDEIVGLCLQFNARASMRLNKRSFRKVAFKAMVNIANSMSNQEYEFIKASYDRACGLGHNDKDKKWILDIDKGDDYEGIKKFLTETPPNGFKYMIEIPSKSGVHLITNPFDLREFSQKFPEIAIMKDNPTNMFIP